MYLLDILIILLVIFAVVKSFFVTTTRLVRKLLAIVLASCFVAALFGFGEVNRVFDPLVGLLDDAFSFIHKNYSSNFFSSDLYTGPGELMLPLVWAIVLLFVFYWIFYGLLSLIIKPMKLERQLLRGPRFASRVANVTLSLLVVLFITYFMMEAAVIISRSVAIEPKVFGYVFRKFSKVDGLDKIAKLLGEVTRFVPKRIS